MSGWLNGVYSKYHCLEPIVVDGEVKRCLKSATLRQFRSENVPLCDDHWKWLLDSIEWACSEKNRGERE